jgi:hypothetical protein
MTRKSLCFRASISFLLFVALTCFQLRALAESDAPVVIELFTSQGCYSCPPADKLLGELKDVGNLIVLACHVTYWNYLGWQDTFSRQFCDDRQRNYQAQLIGNPGVYTPQVVVSGRYGAVGSRASRVKRLISLANTNTPARRIKLSIANDGQLKIELPDTQASQVHRLWLLGTSGSHLLPIVKGENGGKALNYHNPIEYVADLGSWTGHLKTLSKDVTENSNIQEWVVIAQTHPLGGIAAAGKLTLPQ